MAIDATGNQQLLKHLNRMALVRQLCASPGLSRADLAAAVGITKSTVSLLVRELIAEGWLVEREVVATGDLGRRPTPLFIDPSRLLLLGAEVGIGTLRVVATSLNGEVLARAVSSHSVERTAKSCLQGLATALLKIRRQFDADAHAIVGIGVGLPGGVDETTGTLQVAPNLGWRDVPFARLLGERLAGTALANVPLFLQNEADVAALGELEFNTAQSTDPLLYVSMNQGVGAGVIVGDRLLTGRRGFAGEIGHMVLQVDGPICTCGRRGCAEALIGPLAMLRRGTDSTVPVDAALSEVRQRLAAGDAAIGRAVQTAGRYLGVLLHNLATTYDPGCIVLGGAMAELQAEFVQPALQALEDYTAAASLVPPTVRLSQFGADAVAVGAAALVRYHLTRPMLVPGSRATAGTNPEAEAAR